MKSIFLISAVTFLFQLSLTAQGVISFPEAKVLYRNHDNIVRIGFADKPQDFTLHAHGADLSKSSEGVFIVRPYEKVRQVALLCVDSKGDTISNYLFDCLSLSEPLLQWGGVTVENEYSFNDDPFIDIRLPSGSLINIDYKLLNWQITLNNISYSGKGNVLSENIMNTIRNECQSKASIDIKLKVDYQNTVGIASIEKDIRVYSENYLSNSDEYRNIWNNSRIVVIDKAQNTTAIFDESNPFSMVSLIRQNYIKNVFPMSVLTAERLQAQGANLPIGFLGLVSDAPLIESDSLKANYGLEKVEDGNYVYPPRTEYYFEVNDIDRIILFLKDNANQKNGLTINSISHVALCKKFGDNDKYDVVLSFPFHSNLLDLGIIALQESDEINANRFIKMQNELADSTAVINENYFFSISPNSPNKVNYNAGGYYLVKNRNREIDFEFSFSSDLEKPGFRPLFQFDYDADNFSAEAMHNMNSFSWEANHDIFKSLNNAIHSVDYDSIISDIPLMTMYGEDSLDLDGNLVYPIDYHIHKIHFKTNFQNQSASPLKVVLKHQLELNSQDRYVFRPIEVIYCAKNNSNSEWFVVASIDLDSLKTDNYSFLDQPKIEWIQILENEMKKGKVIHLKNRKEKGKLNKEINIDF